MEKEGGQEVTLHVPPTGFLNADMRGRKADPVGKLLIQTYGEKERERWILLRKETVTGDALFGKNTMWRSFRDRDASFYRASSNVD